MMRWQQFLNSLDTAGGHIIILLALVAAGIVAAHHGNTEFLAAAIGALMLKLRGGQS